MNKFLYEELLAALRVSGEKTQRTVEDEFYRVSSLGDFQTTISKNGEKWLLEALTFTVLDQDFFCGA